MSSEPWKAICFAIFFLSVCSIGPTKAQVPSPSPSPTPPLPTTPTTTPLGVLSLDEALRLAANQASSFRTAALNERVAAEDVRQAKAAFLPKITTPLAYTYTSPALGLPAGEPRGPSFVSSDGIGVYDALLNVSGDFDIAGRLRATVAKNRALLAAAHAGTEVARRAFIQSVTESYYGLALASAQRRAAETSLAAAEEFERITSLLLSGGEVAAVDLTRAQLQTLSRRDELEKARVNEQVAAGALHVFIGSDFSKPISTTDLEFAMPIGAEHQQFDPADILRRPEFVQLDQELRAARQEIKIARADRLPSLSYSINGGFDTDSIRGPRLKEHTGVSGAISLSIPIFDFGVSKSRQRQAQLRVEIAENEKLIATRGFTQQFFAARDQAANAVRRVALAREGAAKAEENLNASIARYRAGEAQIVEVTDAQTTLVEKRTALYQAIFDYQVALARLRQATGK